HGADSSSWIWASSQAGAVASVSNGNHGQIMMRFPAAWNFNGAISRRKQAPVKVGVLDVEFGANSDLHYSMCDPAPPNTTIPKDAADHDHGNNTLGIIGAAFGDAYGINGCSPFVDLVGCATGNRSLSGNDIDYLSTLIMSMVARADVLINIPGVRVINISLGYNWWRSFPDADPDSDPHIQRTVENASDFARVVASQARS